MRWIAVIALGSVLIVGGTASAQARDGRLRNATLERSHGTVRLVIRAKRLDAGDRVGVSLAGDLRFAAAKPVGRRLRRWVITPTSRRRFRLLARARRALNSGRVVHGRAVVDDDPQLPDPVRRFTLRAFNRPGAIRR